MENYLETNSLRQLIPEIKNPALTDKTFTSILSLMEIASGIKDESSYKIRKTIIDKVLKSKLTICLNLPETLYLNAFGFDHDDNFMVTGIGQVLILLTKSKSYSSFLSRVKNYKYSEFYNFIISYDKNGSTLFKDFLMKNINTARENTGFKELIKSYFTRWSSNDEKFAQEFYDRLIDYFSEGLYRYKKVLSKKDKRTKEEIKKSYNHSIDTYLIMATAYSDQHISFGNTPGINDYFDLGHLTYLDSISKKIITDDKLLHKLMIKPFSTMIMTTKDFKNKNSI